MGPPLVGVVGAEAEAPAASPALSPVGVLDIAGGDASEWFQQHPTVNRVNESQSTNLFLGWTPEQLRVAQMAD